jgi:hypothetical protein
MFGVCDEVDTFARLTSPVVCGGGWLLALDHRRPVAQPAIRPANNLRR